MGSLFQGDPAVPLHSSHDKLVIEYCRNFSYQLFYVKQPVGDTLYIVNIRRRALIYRELDSRSARDDTNSNQLIVNEMNEKEVERKKRGGERKIGVALVARIRILPTSFYRDLR